MAKDNSSRVAIDFPISREHTPDYARIEHQFAFGLRFYRFLISGQLKLSEKREWYPPSAYDLNRQIKRYRDYMGEDGKMLSYELMQSVTILAASILRRYGKEEKAKEYTSIERIEEFPLRIGRNPIVRVRANGQKSVYQTGTLKFNCHAIEDFRRAVDLPDGFTPVFVAGVGVVVFGEPDTATPDDLEVKHWLLSRSGVGYAIRVVLGPPGQDVSRFKQVRRKKIKSAHKALVDCEAE